MKKSKKKLIIILSIVLVVLILLAILTTRACSSISRRVQDMSAGAEVQILQPQDLSTAISTTGTVESQTVVSVASDLTYKIKELPVQLGDYVEAGQTLCVFDDTALKEEISALEQVISESKRLSAKQAEINKRALEDAKNAKQEALAEAQANIDSAKAAYDRAKANYEAYGDEYYTEYMQADAEHKAALNAYKQTDRSTNETIQACQDAIDTQSTSSDDTSNAKQLAELKRKLEKTTVTAESSGIITSINVRQGSVHAGGELMTIQDNTKMKLVVSLTETDVVKIKEGMTAKITANALEDEEISGTVSKIINFASASTAPVSEEGGSSGSGYSAEILIDAPGNLLLGMSAKAQIILEDVGEALAVSYDSIGYDEDKKPYVFRANENKDGTYTLEKIPVETGVEADYYTQISSDELSEGDYILYYPDAYSDGDTINLNPDFLEE